MSEVHCNIGTLSEKPSEICSVRVKGDLVEEEVPPLLGIDVFDSENLMDGTFIQNIIKRTIMKGNGQENWYGIND